MWETVAKWVVGAYERHRTPFLALGAAALVLLSVLLSGVLLRPPQGLTASDVDEAIERALESTPPPPSYASVAYEVIRPSLVAIQARSPDATEDSQAAVGGGVVIVDDGTILTSLHVVEGAVEISVLFADGSESPALVVVRQPENDLAVLQAMEIPDDLLPATMASVAGLRVGDEVVAVGNPFGIRDSVSAGVVSGLRREYTVTEAGTTITNLIQFDAAANPGNSGGPLLNRNGEVVGIVTSILNPTEDRVFIGIGFAVPIETAAAAAGPPAW